MSATQRHHLTPVRSASTVAALMVLMMTCPGRSAALDITGRVQHRTDFARRNHRVDANDHKGGGSIPTVPPTQLPPRRTHATDPPAPLVNKEEETTLAPLPPMDNQQTAAPTDADQTTAAAPIVVPARHGTAPNAKVGAFGAQVKAAAPMKREAAKEVIEATPQRDDSLAQPREAQEQIDAEKQFAAAELITKKPETTAPVDVSLQADATTKKVKPAETGGAAAKAQAAVDTHITSDGATAGKALPAKKLNHDRPPNNGVKDAIKDLNKWWLDESAASKKPATTKAPSGDGDSGSAATTTTAADDVLPSTSAPSLKPLLPARKRKIIKATTVPPTTKKAAAAPLEKDQDKDITDAPFWSQMEGVAAKGNPNKSRRRAEGKGAKAVPTNDELKDVPTKGPVANKKSSNQPTGEEAPNDSSVLSKVSSVRDASKQQSKVTGIKVDKKQQQPQTSDDADVPVDVEAEWERFLVETYEMKETEKRVSEYLTALKPRHIAFDCSLESSSVAAPTPAPTSDYWNAGESEDSTSPTGDSNKEAGSTGGASEDLSGPRGLCRTIVDGVPQAWGGKVRKVPTALEAPSSSSAGESSSSSAGTSTKETTGSSDSPTDVPPVATDAALTTDSTSWRQKAAGFRKPASIEDTEPPVEEVQDRYRGWAKKPNTPAPPVPSQEALNDLLAGLSKRMHQM